MVFLLLLYIFQPAHNGSRRGWASGLSLVSGYTVHRRAATKIEVLLTGGMAGALRAESHREGGVTILLGNRHYEIWFWHVFSV